MRLGIRRRLLLTIGAVVALTLLSSGLLLRTVVRQEVEAEARAAGEEIEAFESFGPALAARWPGDRAVEVETLLAELRAKLPGASDAQRPHLLLVAPEEDGWRLVATTDPFVADAEVDLIGDARSSGPESSIDPEGPELELRWPAGADDRPGAVQVARLLAPSVEVPGTLGARLFLLPIVDDGLAGSGSGSGLEAEVRVLLSLDRWLVAVLASALALTLAATWWLGRRILGPVEQLTERARHLAAEAPAARGPVRSAEPVGDEVEELRVAFDAMVDALGRTETLRRNLVHDVAHELRTPLTRFRAQLEAAQDGLVALDAPRVATLHQDVLLLARLVHDLEELALAEAGQLHLAREPVGVEALLRSVVRRFENDADGADERAAKIEIVLDPTEPLLPLHADPQRLRQMLDNLLTNARRHTPASGQISVDAVEKDGAIEIAVSDTGPGLDDEAKSKVFDRFVRLDPSRNRSSGGSGLGLAIVAQLAAAHGGRAWVEDRVAGAPGLGCRFVLRLPVEERWPT